MGELLEINDAGRIAGQGCGPDRAQRTATLTPAIPADFDRDGTADLSDFAPLSTGVHRPIRTCA